jgi:glycosyltransferase involved in cell wall biosynthesis
MLEDVFSDKPLTVDSGTEAVAAHLLGVLRDCGLALPPRSRILDFGCGQGRLVESLVKDGFDAYGVDIFDRFTKGPYRSKERCRLITQDPYRIPFGDEEFDAVISASVLEHVMDLEPVISETHRVLRPNGAALHIFPSRLHFPFEPHTRVPLGGIFHPKWWLWLCAHAGLRGPTQIGLNAREAYLDSARFFALAIRYRSLRTYRTHAEKRFGHCEFPIASFLSRSPGGAGTLARRLRLPGLPGLLMVTRQVPLLMRRRRPRAQPLHVLHMITSLSTGGAETMLARLVSTLDQSVTRHTIVSLTTKDPIGPQLERLGTRVIAVGAHGVLSPGQVLAIRRIVRDAQPQVVHSWMYHSNVIAQCLKRTAARPIPLITSIRGAIHAPSRQKTTLRWARKVDALLSRSADAIVFNSQESLRQHQIAGYRSDKAVVIPNGFPIGVLTRNAAAGQVFRSTLRLDAAARLVGVVARFDPLKGHDIFLLAARMISDSRRDIRFLLAGRGCERSNSELASLIDAAGLRDRVILAGEVGDLLGLYNSLDVLVCPSVSEAFPNVVGEAMACGIPCVVTNVGDSAYLVGDGGVVVPPNSPAEISSSVLRIMDMPTSAREALGELGQQRVRQEFSLEVAAARFLSLYRRLAHHADAR